jgi:hypothetical protein
MGVVGERYAQETPTVQENGWAPGPLGTGAGNSPPPEFHLQTVQPVASRFTDCAIPACDLD